MSDTASPNGLVPSRRWGSAPNSTGTNMYNIADGYATAMFTGTLVQVSAGNLAILENGAKKADYLASKNIKEMKSLLGF